MVGAEVAYDEATQAVTAELNGVTVVMTIGSATYTVNGAEKTMDVAPFINGSRTMVPVRFVAEAFGIKVIPTYDQNGATADILFNLYSKTEPLKGGALSINIYSSSNNLTDYRLTGAVFCTGRMSAALRAFLRRQLYLYRIALRFFSCKYFQKNLTHKNCNVRL